MFYVRFNDLRKTQMKDNCTYSYIWWRDIPGHDCLNDATNFGENVECRGDTDEFFNGCESIVVGKRGENIFRNIINMVVINPLEFLYRLRYWLFSVF